MSYLLVADGAAGGAFVAVDPPVSDWLQPVSIAPIRSPMSTIRVYVLFILRLTFIKSPKSTSKIFRHFQWVQWVSHVGSGFGVLRSIRRHGAITQPGPYHQGA